MTAPDNKVPSRHPATGAYKKRLLFIIFVGVLLFVCLQLWVSPRIGFVGYSHQHFYLQDYAYHIILTNHFWFVENGDIYDLDFQLEALSAYMQRQALVTMPVGVTPLALIVWLPFAYIAKFSLGLSYSLWTAFSITLLALALWEIYAYLSPLQSYPRLPWELCGITFFSLVGASAVVVGQTSFFAAGLLCFIIYRIVRPNHEKGKFSPDWPLIMMVVLAGLKPPYLIIGFGMLFIYGRWRDLFYAAMVVLLLMAILTLMLTTDWLPSYVNLLGMYSRGDFPDIYAWSVVPETMNIFRSAISDLTGDGVAAVGSTLLSVLIFTGIGVLKLFKPAPVSTTDPKLIVALIACCLLFAPNSGAYEDILLIPVFVTVLLTGKTRPCSSFKSKAIAGALFISLLHDFPLFRHNFLWVFFGLKFMVLATMIHYAGADADISPPVRHPAE